ncbi:MAG: hypothetical protein QXG55_05455, partial [Thermoplasmata archaeon]
RSYPPLGSSEVSLNLALFGGIHDSPHTKEFVPYVFSPIFLPIDYKPTIWTFEYACSSWVFIIIPASGAGIHRIPIWNSHKYYINTDINTFYLFIPLPNQRISLPYISILSF